MQDPCKDEETNWEPDERHVECRCVTCRPPVHEQQSNLRQLLLRVTTCRITILQNEFPKTREVRPARSDPEMIIDRSPEKNRKEEIETCAIGEQR